MKLFYTLLDAVSYLKWQIEKEEKRLKKTRSEAKRHWLEGNIEWMFERALELVKLAKPGEIKQEALDFFLGRISERPDKARIVEQLKKRYDKTIPPSQPPSQANPSS